MIPIECKHCGSQDRERQCRYWWWMPYAEEKRAATGGAAPCDYQRAREAQASLIMENAKRRLKWSSWILVIFAACVLIFTQVYRHG